MNHVRATALLLMLGAALLTAASACGGGGDDGGSQEPTKLPATAGSSPAATADDGSSDDGDDDGASTITLIAKNTLFDKSELRAKAGEITITFDNQDGGIVHNLHVYKGQDATGEDVGATEFEAGPIVQTLKLDLEPGEYFYACNAHPATQFGKLIVEEE